MAAVNFTRNGIPIIPPGHIFALRYHICARLFCRRIQSQLLLICCRMEIRNPPVQIFQMPDIGNHDFAVSDFLKQAVCLTHRTGCRIAAFGHCFRINVNILSRDQGNVISSMIRSHITSQIRKARALNGNIIQDHITDTAGSLHQYTLILRKAA